MSDAKRPVKRVDWAELTGDETVMLRALVERGLSLEAMAYCAHVATSRGCPPGPPRPPDFAAALRRR